MHRPLRGPANYRRCPSSSSFACFKVQLQTPLLPFDHFKTAFEQSELLRCCVESNLDVALLLPSLRQAPPSYLSLVFASGPALLSRTLRLHCCLLFRQSVQLRSSTSSRPLFSLTMLTACFSITNAFCWHRLLSTNIQPQLSTSSQPLFSPGTPTPYILV